MVHDLLSNTTAALFVAITGGLLLGRIKLAGLSLGASGVIFAALLLGHLGYSIPAGVGPLGAVVFIYCVGLRAGPGFFRGFVRQGRKMAMLAALVILLAAATAAIVARLMHLPVDLAAGMFAGALTSTPGLAAALERLPANSDAPVAYGVSYVIGLLAVVVFVQLLPRLLRQDLEQLGRSPEAEDQAESQIVHRLVEVANPAITGKKLGDLLIIGESSCQVARVLRGNRLVPITSDLTLQGGEHLLLVGKEARLATLIPLLG
ncbi:MAG: YidE/YbjL duplication, partial [Acidobacteria bacterium]|nr:YidE/YbjL duplication [Acidobacteriota bacterium]